MKLKKLSCKRCDHNWLQRTERLPIVCPRCKSPYWNTNKVKLETKRKLVLANE